MPVHALRQRSKRCRDRAKPGQGVRCELDGTEPASSSSSSIAPQSNIQRVFGAERLVNEAADGLFLAVPDPADATGFLVFAPQPRIDVRVIVEGATTS
jgi:hypothetical protein